MIWPNQIPPMGPEWINRMCSCRLKCITDLIFSLSLITFYTLWMCQKVRMYTEGIKIRWWCPVSQITNKKQVELDASTSDRIFVFICIPEIPLKYTSNRRKLLNKNRFTRFWLCCELDPVWINSKVICWLWWSFGINFANIQPFVPDRLC